MAGGGSLPAYNVAAVVVFAALLACFVTTYPALKPAAFLLPSVALFFADRSFGSYLVHADPGRAGRGGHHVGHPPRHQGRPGPGGWSRSGGDAPSSRRCVVALTAPSPPSVSIASVHTTGQLATVGQVTLAVRGQARADHPVRPAFTVENGTTMTAFWQRASGPAVLGPHQQAQHHRRPQLSRAVHPERLPGSRVHQRSGRR